MILTALNQYYETLCIRGELSAPGWTDNFKVSFGLDLNDEGEIVRVIDFREEVLRGKKTATLPKSMRVPAHSTRTSGTLANFLCDNSAYMLGVDGKGNFDKAMRCFAANKVLHEQILDPLAETEKAAQAILAFFRNWRVEEAEKHPCLNVYWDSILRGVNLIFCYKGVPAAENKSIQDVWQDHFDKPDLAAPWGQCLVTGKAGTIATTHPQIKGVKGAKATGATLSSYNCPSFCSYGHEQNLNAPVSERAAFGYTTALNHLISDRAHTRVVGDTTVVCWAEHGDPLYQDAYMSALFGNAEAGPEGVLTSFLNRIAKGEPMEWDGNLLDRHEHFYVLGLAPNAARLSVRFFYKDSFGAVFQNIQKHYEDFAIVKPSFDPWEHLPLWKILSETVNENSSNKEPSPHISGALLRSILNGTPYPAALINGVQQRIRADKKITRGRAAVIKAYYTRANIPFPKEVLTVDGNKNTNNVAYTLGRLFSIYEQIQERAYPNINTTIKDRYFNSASATPALTMSVLGNLAQKHLRVIRRSSPGAAVYFEKLLGEYSRIIGDSYPARLSIAEQGAFQLGYYFENQERYTPRKNNEHDGVED